MKKKKYSVSQLIEACKTSNSYSMVIVKLGLIPAGGNYQTIKKEILDNNIDISHFTGKGWNQGERFRPVIKKKSLDEILQPNSSYNSNRLKQRLISEKIFQRKCHYCGLEKWLCGLIPLELEHIDGDHSNNSLDNLTLLCPNCHALTSTYRGKNKLGSALSVKSSPN